MPAQIPERLTVSVIRSILNPLAYCVLIFVQGCMSLDRRQFNRAGALAALYMLTSSGFGCRPETRARQKRDLDPAFLRDKFAGMILLGAYGDALGARHEPAGLQGAAGDPDRARQLAPAHTYQPREALGGPWWVWVDGADIPAGLKGVPTDDSAFRLMILHPWLSSLDGRLPEESLFVDWLEGQQSAPAEPAGSSWQDRRDAQIRDWLVMFADARRGSERARSGASSSDPFQHSPGNPFFRVNVPVVFGMFMYLEVAALFASLEPRRVMDRFSTYCMLDQGYAGEITGLFAALTASAVSTPPDNVDFSSWYHEEVQRLLARPLSPSQHTSLLRNTFDSAWRWGVEHRSQPEQEVLLGFKREIYEAPLPGQRDTAGYRVFDPLLFFRMMSAILAYARDDAAQALTLLASSPGDADTLPSMLGALMGAWYGRDALLDLSFGATGDLDRIEDTLSILFDYDMQRVLDVLVDLSVFIQSNE